MEANRICVAIFNWNKSKVLMVLHNENGRKYFTLPGGGKEVNETDEETGIREVKEETGLKIKIQRYIYEYEFMDKNVKKITKCYLGKRIGCSKISLGIDPEEIGKKEKMLIGLEWKKIKEMKDDLQIKEVIRTLNIKV